MIVLAGNNLNLFLIREAMKNYILILIAALFSFSSLAYANMTPEEQILELENISKNIRRDYWISGHESVGSNFEYLSKGTLDDYIQMNNNDENPLDSEEIANLYKCFHGKTCELYLVYVSAEYMGGTGINHHYILLYPKSGKHHEISHNVYAE